RLVLGRLLPLGVKVDERPLLEHAVQRGRDVAADGWLLGDDERLHFVRTLAPRVNLTALLPGRNRHRPTRLAGVPAAGNRERAHSTGRRVCPLCEPPLEPRSLAPRTPPLPAQA